VLQRERDRVVDVHAAPARAGGLGLRAALAGLFGFDELVGEG
jgi:hypothetical protein